MYGGFKILKSISVLAFVGLASTAVLAQTVQNVSRIAPVSGLRCQCGRWTCPACQQQQLCDPCLPGQSVPEVNLLPNAPVISPSDLGNMAVENMAQPLPPVISPSDLGAPTQPSNENIPSEAAVAPESGNFSDAGAAAPSLSTPASGPNTSNLFASNLGGGSGGSFGSSLRGATTPEMMGDFFGPGGAPSIFNRDSNTYFTPVPNAGYMLGRMKLAENNSPIPRDRIFFNYSHFTGVPLASQPISVNRYSPGFEKTFWSGLASFEMRTPFGSSLDNDILANGLTSDNQFQFGNLFLALKGVLLQQNNWLVTGGTSLLLPTAADTRVIDPVSGREFLRFDNQSTHIMPFIGGAYLPRDRLFAQWMVQCDIDANGNPVLVTDGNGQRQIGTMQDFTLLYTDLSVGYWLYKAGRAQDRMVTGIAPIAELHYNRSLTTADSVSDGNNQINQVISDFDNVNMQVGLIFNLRNNSRLGFGYATPLGNSYDRIFDKEFRVTLNHYF